MPFALERVLTPATRAMLNVTGEWFRKTYSRMFNEHIHNPAVVPDPAIDTFLLEELMVEAWLMLTNRETFPPTYRVAMIKDPQTKKISIHVSQFDVAPSFDTKVTGVYDSADELPRWMQERLAVLMMTKSDYPTEEIPDVGRRITDSVFWVFGHTEDQPSV